MDLLQKAWDIKIENLSAGYKDKTVIKSMNAHIPAQQITAVLGGIRLRKNNFVKSFSGAYSCAKR